MHETTGRHTLQSGSPSSLIMHDEARHRSAHCCCTAQFWPTIPGQRTSKRAPATTNVDRRGSTAPGESGHAPPTEPTGSLLQPRWRQRPSACDTARHGVETTAPQCPLVGGSGQSVAVGVSKMCREYSPKNLLGVQGGGKVADIKEPEARQRQDEVSTRRKGDGWMQLSWWRHN